jgi:YD repeat-containing protein
MPSQCAHLGACLRCHTYPWRQLREDLIGLEEAGPPLVKRDVGEERSPMVARVHPNPIGLTLRFDRDGDGASVSWRRPRRPSVRGHAADQAGRPVSVTG